MDDFKKRIESLIYLGCIWFKDSATGLLALPVENDYCSKPLGTAKEHAMNIALKLPENFPSEKIEVGGIGLVNIDLLDGFPTIKRDLFLYTESKRAPLTIKLDLKKSDVGINSKITLKEIPFNEQDENFLVLQTFLSVKAKTPYGSGLLFQSFDVIAGYRFINKTLIEIYELSEELVSEAVKTKSGIAVAEKRVLVYQKTYLLFQVIKRILDAICICKVATLLDNPNLMVKKKPLLESDSFMDLFFVPEVEALPWFSRFKVFFLLTNELCNHFKHDQDSAASLNILPPDFARILARRKTKNGKVPFLQKLLSIPEYGKLLPPLLEEIGDFKDNNYIEFDIYLTTYASLLREFLEETIFQETQGVEGVLYSLSFSRSFCVEEEHRVFSTQLSYSLDSGYENSHVARQTEITF